MATLNLGKSGMRAHGLSRLLWLAATLLALFQNFDGLLLAQDFTESQVKALFLLNFTKYVEWPTNAFEDDSTPITIGILGTSKVQDELEKIVVGRTTAHRPIVVRRIESPSDFSDCQVLFVSSSETKHLAEILRRLHKLPVLTVGETEQFLDAGGMINFVPKDGKIRLTINLVAARDANLQISSKLLSVADAVKEK
jgi:hypothetical protein